MIKRVYKRSTAGWFLCAAIVLLVGGRWVYDTVYADRLAAPANLVDGSYRIEKIIDPVTLIVREDRPGSRPFRLRLAGVHLLESTDELAREQAMQVTRDFVYRNLQFEEGAGAGHQGVEPLVELQFDRTYLAEDRTALAYLVVGEEILNVTLCKKGLVIPDPVTGNSPSIQRKIRAASSFAESLGLGVHAAD